MSKQTPEEMIRAVLSNVGTRAAIAARDAFDALLAGYRAELSRLKPSGQVVEDFDNVLLYLESGRANAGPGLAVDGYDNAMNGARRLAAMAQGYEAAVADNAELVRWLAEAQAIAIGTDAEFDLLGITEPNAHPGAALLDQHRKEVDTLRTQVERLNADLRVAGDFLRAQETRLASPYSGGWAERWAALRVLVERPPRPAVTSKPVERVLREADAHAVDAGIDALQWRVLAEQRTDEIERLTNENTAAKAEVARLRAMLTRIVGDTPESWNEWEDGDGNQLGNELLAVLGGNQ